MQTRRRLALASPLLRRCHYLLRSLADNVCGCAQRVSVRQLDLRQVRRVPNSQATYRLPALLLIPMMWRMEPADQGERDEQVAAL